ncbi:MAG: Hsp70 family protein, partial [Deltaproteobacteria bacterium]|nr:Hsp70 family protein [Deltaproteobacteria bacterium]
MSSPRVIGIDLGTSYSSVSAVINNKPVVIPSPEGYNTIPSVVAYTKDGEILTGYKAQRYTLIDPENSIIGSKRLIGRRYRSKTVQDILRYFKYRIVEDKNGSCAVNIGGAVISLEQIAAIILTELKNIASRYLNEDISRAVVTVPAFYNESQRIAVRRAGELAGLRIERILNEPTAAAIAFGFGRNLKRRIFVYDFGGGTFDVSVLNVDNTNFEVECTGGDTFLGGYDFDSRLLEIILEKFENRNRVSIRNDNVAMQRVLEVAEIAKIELSSTEETRVIVPAIAVSNNISLSISEKISRAEFEKRTEELIDRSIVICDSVLIESNIERDSLNDILLVGGQTRMPLIRKKVREFFQKEPLYRINPSEAVATGAAIVADGIYRESLINFTDVLPQSIGFSPDSKRYVRIVPKNSKLPVTKEIIILNNANYSPSIEAVIYQGDSPFLEANEILGVLQIKGITKAPKSMIRVKVR